MGKSIAPGSYLQSSVGMNKTNTNKSESSGMICHGLQLYRDVEGKEGDCGWQLYRDVGGGRKREREREVEANGWLTIQSLLALRLERVKLTDHKWGPLYHPSHRICYSEPLSWLCR